MRLVLALLAAGLLAQPAAGATGTTIPNCFSQEVAPDAIVLACGDGNLSLVRLHWQDWGAASTVANGTAHVNDCSPDCAAGTFRTYPVTVTASGPKTCPSGRRQYTHLAWSTQAKPPPGQANPAGEMTFPCSWDLHPGLKERSVGGKIVLTGTAWTRDASCPRKVTLTTGGDRIVTAALTAKGGFVYAWSAPSGRHLVVARQRCRGSVLYEAAVLVG